MITVPAVLIVWRVTHVTILTYVYDVHREMFHVNFLCLVFSVNM